MCVFFTRVFGPVCEESTFESRESTTVSASVLRHSVRINDVTTKPAPVLKKKKKKNILKATSQLVSALNW